MCIGLFYIQAMDDAVKVLTVGTIGTAVTLSTGDIILTVLANIVAAVVIEVLIDFYRSYKNRMR